MQAVGLSKKQLMKMLNTENGYLIFGSFIVSIFLGSTLGYFICKAAGNTGGLSYIQYRFPFWIIVIYFLLIITLQGITIGCIGIGMRKNSLIERLSEI
jgi:putative ABC transport system permease protein